MFHNVFKISQLLYLNSVGDLTGQDKLVLDVFNFIGLFLQKMNLRSIIRQRKNDIYQIVNEIIINLLV